MVQIESYWSQTLLKSEEVYRGTQTGLTDLGSYVYGTNAGLHPLHDFAALPFIGWPSMAAANEIYGKLSQQFPEIEGEFEGVKLLWYGFMPPYLFSFTDKEVRTTEDIKGMKLVSSDVTTPLLQAIGASPIDVDLSEYYISLERGLAEGIGIHYPAQNIFGLNELLPYHTEFGEGGYAMVPQFLIMNLDAWNKLPPDTQEIFEDVFPNYQTPAIVAMDENDIKTVRGMCEELGHSFVYLTPEEIQEWAKYAQPIHDKWIADNEARGLPAQAIYDEAKRLISEYAK